MPARDRFGLVSAWVPVLIWAAVIWILGSDPWSAPQTSRILGPLLDWLCPGLDALDRDVIVNGIRKLAHPAVYGLLALLSLRALELTTRSRSLAMAAAALGAVAAVATADEVRQAASGVRTGAVGDVLLDVGGGITAIVLCLAIERALGRRIFARGSAREVSRPERALEHLRQALIRSRP